MCLVLRIPGLDQTGPAPSPRWISLKAAVDQVLMKSCTGDPDDRHSSEQAFRQLPFFARREEPLCFCEVVRSLERPRPVGGRSNLS